jgi:hypothetical protein
MKETQLVRQSLDYCEYQPNMPFTRTQAGAVRTEKSFIKFGKAGWPDITGCYHGKFVGIECKVGKNTQSESQKFIGDKIKIAGGEYFIIHSLDEFILAINNL